MSEGRRRAYILLGVIGALEAAALVVLFAYPSSKTTPPAAIISHTATTTMRIESSAFEPNTSIPQEYTCDGRDSNPPLTFFGVPKGAKSLVLIMHDPDVPKVLKFDGVFDHWVLYNIPPTTMEIAAGSNAGTLGLNSAGRANYFGPCPPAQYEPWEHRYVFTLYALDQELQFSRTPDKEGVLSAMEGHVLEHVEFVGKYQKKVE